MRFKQLRLTALPVKAADGILLKLQMPGTNSCHLKFPGEKNLAHHESSSATL